MAGTLSPSCDIPFNQLVLSQANVRRIKAGVSVEELAGDIARRGLLQGLGVRPVVDEAGAKKPGLERVIMLDTETTGFFPMTAWSRLRRSAAADWASS